MSFHHQTTPDPTLMALIARVGATPPARWLLVDVAHQRVVLVHGATPEGHWPISTATAGLDSRQDSGGTPPGLHRIHRKIGADCALGTVFISREPTGEVWTPDQPRDDTPDLILTRILTLVGCEPGINLGPGVDSQQRHIYLHGTNDEQHLGQPVSHGCIRLSNADIRELFDQVDEGDPVVII